VGECKSRTEYTDRIWPGYNYKRKHDMDKERDKRHWILLFWFALHGNRFADATAWRTCGPFDLTQWFRFNCGKLTTVVRSEFNGCNLKQWQTVLLSTAANLDTLSAPLWLALFLNVFWIVHPKLNSFGWAISCAANPFWMVKSILLNTISRDIGDTMHDSLNSFHNIHSI
jgi:hypothetical protein